MDQRIAIVLLIVVLVLVAGILGWLYSRQRRRRILRERFGPEYDRVIREQGNVRRGEGVLELRERKRESLRIFPLSAGARSDFSNRWRGVQSQFVDDPEGTVVQADRLLSEVMKARGYPVENFEERAAILLVDHPLVIENYRAGHAIAIRRSQGQASTEDLRKAMIHYRLLFDELLQDALSERKEARA
jgi:hypothetical protein